MLFDIRITKYNKSKQQLLIVIKIVVWLSYIFIFRNRNKKNDKFVIIENHRPIGRFSLAPAESCVTVLWSFGFVDLCI